jgi:hypothetical protein
MAEAGATEADWEAVFGDENFQVYGVRKFWRQMTREGRELARCTWRA